MERLDSQPSAPAACSLSRLQPELPPEGGTTNPLNLLPALALSYGQTGPLLAGLLPWLAEGRLAYCLDGGNCFNPYTLTTQARAQGLDPLPLLERLFVSRAYTCYQLLESVKTMLAPLAENPDPPLALILGLDALFLEDEIGLEERRRIFSRLAARAAGLARRGLPLLITLLGARTPSSANAELNFIYAPFQILGARASSPALEVPLANSSLQLPASGLIPHPAFRISDSFRVWKES